MKTKQIANAQEWDRIVNSLGGNPLQLWGWGKLKDAHNWDVERIAVLDDDGATIGAAQLLVRPLPFPLRRLFYAPRGPVWAEGRGKDVLAAVGEYAKKRGGASLMVEPDVGIFPDVAGYKESPNHVLIPSTLILDLNQTEDELMADMVKKTRQYVRKSARDGVEAREVTNREDLEPLLDMYEETAERAGFALHARQYYLDVFDMLGKDCKTYAAYVDGQPASFLMLAVSDTTSFELYGGMNDLGQHSRANYMLKWHAITAMKAQGVKRYDMNGLLNDGVSKFKEGFASHENMLAGTYDLPLSPFYPVWSKGLPLAKSAMRKIRNFRKK